MNEKQLSSRVTYLLMPAAALLIAGYAAFFLTGVQIDQPGASAKSTKTTTASTASSKTSNMTSEQMKMMIKNDEIKGSAVATETGQAVAVMVDTGYNPNVIEVKKGVPLTMTFQRDSTFKCSKKVQFPSMSTVMTVLPDDGKATVIVPIPNAAGQTIEFMCGMKMIKGKLVTVD